MGAAAGIIGSVLSSSAQSGQNGNANTQQSSQAQSISNAGSNTPDIKQADVKEAATNKPDTKENNVNWEEIARMSQSLANEGGQSAPISSNNFSGGQPVANFR